MDRVERDIAGTVVASLVRYVDRACGPGGVALLRDLAAEPLDVDALLDDSRWYTTARVVALADAAVVVTGDPGVGRRAGEELLRTTQARGIDSFIRAAGSPEAALVNLVAFGSKMSRGRSIEPLDVGDREVVLRAWYDGVEPHPFICSFGPGFWAGVPSLFGATGTAVEERCQGRGDDWCIYRVRWDVAADVEAHEAAQESAAGNGLVAGFERLQATASELARADTVETVLDRIVEGADRAIVAPIFVAAVRVDSGPVDVSATGLDRAEAEDCALRLLADPSDRAYGLPVVAPLASHRGEYGLLAALLPPGAVLGETDQRLLAAYAGHATAALEAVMARGLAERNHAVSQGLLDLATTLAAVASPKDVCEHVADAVPAMTGCALATVWRWSATHRVLELVAHRGQPIQHTRLTTDDVGSLGGLETSRRTLLLDVDTVAKAKLADDMHHAGIVQAAIVPIAARGEFLGIVTAGFVERRRTDDADLFQRLHGLADLAATALDNALLVERMRHQALHDALTGLPNRPLIEDRVHQAIRAARRTNGGLTLMFVDLDRFKNVNDTLGHTAGDALIRQAAARLSAAVRSEDTLARMGGDEFVLLLPGTSDRDAAEGVAEKLIGSLREPFHIDGRQLYISCSVGIASWPDHGEDYEHLLLHADAAMYEAKARGRNTFAFHSGATWRRRELLDLENRLHTALEGDELLVLYQPQLDLATGGVVAVEALVRWDHPDLGRLAPDRFLHLAEESGVITRIDAWVRERALADMRGWLDEGVDLRVSMNLSTADLRRPELLADLTRAIDEARVPIGLVEVEITDRVALGDDDLRPMLDALAGLGLRLAVDDFGVGSSVIGRLQHRPFHTLKIDRSLVRELGREPRQGAIVHALVTMSRELGLSVVAEGVETEEQADILRGYGCPYAQGFWFSPPIDAAAVLPFASRAAASRVLGAEMRP
ncbi:MAG TPA: EAL domain-containing protein [Acidimicrobiales bacterium]